MLEDTLELVYLHIINVVGCNLDVVPPTAHRTLLPYLIDHGHHKQVRRLTIETESQTDTSEATGDTDALRECVVRSSRGRERGQGIVK